MKDILSIEREVGIGRTEDGVRSEKWGVDELVRGAVKERYTINS